MVSNTLRDWYDPLLDRLESSPICGYRGGGAPASEPTALAALALSAGGREEAAATAAGWLAKLQTGDGSVAVVAGASWPAWTTSLAALCWLAVTNSLRDQQARVERAVRWILSVRGETHPRCAIMGHDTSIPAWSWVRGSHSWIEPTAFHLLTLKATGHGNHVRARDAVRLILDRQLPDGGCNYGNSIVYGNTLRPHVQPTGIALLGLAGENVDRGPIERSLDYLEGHVGPDTTTSSLCWALAGLTAHGRYPRRAGEWLEQAFRRTERQGDSPYKFALIALAALADESPLITLPKTANEHPSGRAGKLDLSPF